MNTSAVIGREIVVNDRLVPPPIVGHDPEATLGAHLREWQLTEAN